jgi:magnesium chelatase family protein
MALARTLSVALVGMQAHVVEVEVDVATGLPHFTLTALSDTVLKQVEHRVRSAVVNSGETWPNRKTTVGLSPAMVPKRGSGFDLAIAATMLAAAESLPLDALRDVVVLGELSLDGSVKPVTGILPSIIGAFRKGHRRFVVPRANAGEAALVRDAQVTGVATLGELCAWLRGELVPEPATATTGGGAGADASDCADFVDVVGQERGRRAMEIAAAGGHHVLLTGPPGVGKTMLAERLPGILPDLTDDEALEVTALHSVAGRLARGRPLITRPPFVAPHHTATFASVVGGGAGIASPGAISLAHRGVLFLDEAPEFGGRVLDSLRQPLESGSVTLARAGGVATYPARFLLVLAANPCACAAGAQASAGRGCECSGADRRRYTTRLSGPFRDRVDVVVTLDDVTPGLLGDRPFGDTTEHMRARVEAARARARDRLQGTPWCTTAEVPGPVVRRRWPPPRPLLQLIQNDVDRGTLSNRGVDRVLKLAWTLADLAGCPVGADQVDEALSLRHGTRVIRRHAVPA